MTDDTRAELSDLEDRLSVAIAEYDDAVARPPARDASNDQVMADVAMAHGHLFRFALVEIGSLRAQLATATTRLAALNDYDNTVAGKLRQQLNEMQAIRSAAQADTKSAPSTCWLIERGQKEFHTPTIWYAGKSSHPDDARYNGRWTENANRAIRFSTQSECEATVYNEFMRYWGDKRVNCHASEHVFLSQELTYSTAITAERARCAAIARAHGAEDIAGEIEGC